MFYGKKRDKMVLQASHKGYNMAQGALLLYKPYNHFVLGCEIACTIKIDSSFTLYNNERGNVINSNTVISNDGWLCDNTFIGTKDFYDNGKVFAPLIEDRVETYPNVFPIISDL